MDLKATRLPLQQGQSRTRLRHQKLKTAFIGYIVVLIFIAVLQFIGVLFFSQGFLLSRQVLPNVAQCVAEDGFRNCMTPRFKKMVVVVVDALRFDFVIPVEEDARSPRANENYHNNFPVLYELAQREPENAVLLKFVANPPTTTLQRLKGLTTGSLPTFIDAGSNFNGDAITEDNWVLQLARHNRTVAVVGDDTWSALFGQHLSPALSRPYDSLNVWDLHTVDNGVVQHMLPLLHPQNASRWDVLVGHMLGVDHAGHRYGPDHHGMRDKLRETNAFVADVARAIDDDTLLVVMGDHGMDRTGNHGGESADEVNSTLFLYAKPGTAPFAPKPRAAYDPSNLGVNYRSVDQIDLVPTVSLLLGLPVPFNNLGFPIDEAFGMPDAQLDAAYLTVQQIMRYCNHSREVQGNADVKQRYAAAMAQYDASTYHASTDVASTAQSRRDVPPDHAPPQNRRVARSGASFEAIPAFRLFQRTFLEHCQGLWARFDVVLMALGIAVLVLSLTVLVTYSRSIPSVRVLTLSFEFIGLFIAMSLLGLVSSLSIYLVLRPSAVTLKTCILSGCAAGITVGFWAPIMDWFSVLWLAHQIADFFVYNVNIFSSMGLVFVFLHCAIFASNSFVVWEDRLVLWFLCTVGVSCLAAAACCAKPRAERILGVTHALTFVVLTRVVAEIYVCREEQGTSCRATFRTSWWSVALLFALALVVPKTIKAFYRLTGSYHAAAPLWIESGMSFLMVMTALYWTLEYVEHNDALQQRVTRWLGLELVKLLKLALARLVVFIALGLATFSWSCGPLCVRIHIPDAVNDAKTSNDVVTNDVSPGSDASYGDKALPPPRPGAAIPGFENVYGASYFLLIINFAVAVLLVTKPLGAHSVCMLLVQMLSLLELFDLLDLRKNLIAPVTFGLLGYQHFFSTGHQATLSSIQWEVGFMTTQSIVFPFTHLNIVLNTFGLFILVCVALPLITLWRLPPSTKPITILSQIVTNVTTLMTYQTLTSILSFIFVAHFRRHLMVWKVFAPRFMLSAILLVVFNVSLTAVTMGFSTRRLVTQVNRIFGR